MWECVNALVGLVGKMNRGIEKGRRETSVVCRRLCRQGLQKNYQSIFCKSADCHTWEFLYAMHWFL